MMRRKHIYLLLVLSLLNYTGLAQRINCLEFDGKDDLVETNNIQINSIDTNDFTFECWINGLDSLYETIGYDSTSFDSTVTFYQGTQNSHPMIFSSRDNNLYGVLFFFHSRWGGSKYKMLCVQLNQRNYSIINNGTYDGDLLDGQYHHVAITRQNNILSFFADGELFGTVSLYYYSEVIAPESIWIGQDRATNNTFNGTLAQLRIWNYARSEQEIKSTRYLSLPITTPGIIAYWELKEGIGQHVFNKAEGTTIGTLGHSNLIENNDPTWHIDCWNFYNETDPLSTNNLIAHESSITLFPNPVNDYLNISMSNNEFIQEIKILNLTGQILMTINSTQTTNISLTDFAAGMYIIQCTDSFGKLYQKKFMKV